MERGPLLHPLKKQEGAQGPFLELSKCASFSTMKQEVL